MCPMRIAKVVNFIVTIVERFLIMPTKNGTHANCLIVKSMTLKDVSRANH